MIESKMFLNKHYYSVFEGNKTFSASLNLLDGREMATVITMVKVT